METLIKTSNLPTKVSDIDTLRNQLIQQVKDGHFSALDMIAIGKTYELIVKGEEKKGNGILDQLLDLALSELSQYGKDPVKRLIFDITQIESGTTYDYSHDPIWVKLNDALTVAKDTLKKREELLKNVPKPDILKGIEPMTELDKETGEYFELRPPVKTSKTTLKFTKLK